MIRYVRCRYAFWLLDRGEITIEDTVDEFQIRLLQEGNEFQDAVASSAIPAQVVPEDVEAPLERGGLLFGVPGFENRELKIRGQPEGVEVAGGALLPVEIQSHRDVQRTDELELAFYWMLLEPYRTVQVTDPRGYLMLRRDGAPEQVEVSIRPHRLDAVRRLIDAVRDARRHGVRAGICGCAVCRRLKREDVLRATRSRNDLTLIFRIGRACAEALEGMGVADWDALLGCDPTVIADRLRARGYFVSTAEVERWQRHAESWSTRSPVYFGDGPCLDGGSFLALDLEYEASGLIWLVGICVVSGDRREHTSLWADDAREEERNARDLLALVMRHRDVPIVTWNGVGADVPRRRNAGARFGLPELTEALEARHRDLYLYAMRSLRLPIASLSLKDVAEYYGIPKISAVRDGLEAEMMYGEYRRTQDHERKRTLREQLLDYNRDDVDGLIGVAERLRAGLGGRDVAHGPSGLPPILWTRVCAIRTSPVDGSGAGTLDGFLHAYNHHRCHTAVGGPPASRVNNAPGHHG